MARMTKPWRAMVLVSVFALSACEPLPEIAAPLVNGASADSEASSPENTQPKTEVTAVVKSGVESLVVMSGPTDEDGLLGAGCTADIDEDLPDGDWFGFVLEADRHDLLVDIACVYGPGTEQFEVYSAMDDSQRSNFVVINDVVEERRLRIQSGALAYVAAEDWQPREVRELVEERAKSPRDSTRGVWLRVENGRVAAVVQPYTAAGAAG